MALDRDLIRIICSHLDENSRSAFENKLIPNHEDYRTAVESTILDMVPEQPLGLVRVKSKNDMADDEKDYDTQQNDTCMLDNGDILETCIKDPLCERDMQGVKALLRALTKNSKLCQQILLYAHVSRGDIKIQDVNENKKTPELTEEQRKHIIMNALNEAGMLPIIQYVICDSLLTGGLGCAHTGHNLAALIQDIAPLIVATGCTWDDFFTQTPHMILLPKSPVTMAIELDCPEILLSVLGIKTFTHDTINLYYDYHGVNLYGYVVQNEKTQIASRIADDLAHEPRKKVNPAAQNSQTPATAASQAYHRLHFLGAVKTSEPLTTDAILNLFTAMHYVKLAAQDYLRLYPVTSYRHSHQAQADELIAACNDCMKGINNKMGKAYMPAIIHYLEKINAIYTRLTDGTFKYSLGSHDIMPLLAKVANQLQTKGHLESVNRNTQDAIKQFVKRGMLEKASKVVAAVT